MSTGLGRVVHAICLGVEQLTSVQLQILLQVSGLRSRFSGKNVLLPAGFEGHPHGEEDEGLGPGAAIQSGPIVVREARGVQP